MATGAMQFDINDLDQLCTIDDIKNSVYAKVVHQLQEMRRSNEVVAYAYIKRLAERKGYWKYVADADSINPLAQIDSF
ncbi:MAG: hypothetical protein WCS85_02010 [Candidatus Peribacteraceae bacterium]